MILSKDTLHMFEEFCFPEDLRIKGIPEILSGDPSILKT